MYLWKNSAEKESLFAGDMFSFDKAKLEGKEYDYITAYEHWDAVAHRTTGVYRLGTAEAELSFNGRRVSKMGSDYDDDTPAYYHLKLKFEKYEDAKELYRRIRAGSINPLPGLNYEEEQSSANPREMIVRYIHDYPTPWAMVVGYVLRLGARIRWRWKFGW